MTVAARSYVWHGLEGIKKNTAECRDDRAAGDGKQAIKCPWGEEQESKRTEWEGPVTGKADITSCGELDEIESHQSAGDALGHPCGRATLGGERRIVKLESVEGAAGPGPDQDVDG